MFVADELPSADAHRRRRSHHHRSGSSRFLRKLRQGWRRTKLGKTLFTLILGTAAVAGGYKATMYVIRQDVNLQQFSGQ